jgi:hypothetical protein
MGSNTVPLEKLTASQLSKQPRGGRRRPEYSDFIGNLRSGEGGRATVDSEKATKQTIKNRLKKAANEAGVNIEFIRSSPKEVLFRINRR